MPDYHIPLLPDHTYHIFNRAVGNEQLYRKDENYRFFLRKFNGYISPIVDTISFSLLPNHFHYLIRVKDIKKIEMHFQREEACQRF